MKRTILLLLFMASISGNIVAQRNTKSEVNRIVRTYYTCITLHIEKPSMRASNREELNVMFTSDNIVQCDLNLLNGKSISTYTNIDEYLNQIQYYANKMGDGDFMVEWEIDENTYKHSPNSQNCVATIDVHKVITYGSKELELKDKFTFQQANEGGKLLIYKIETTTEKNETTPNPPPSDPTKPSFLESFFYATSNTLGTLGTTCNMNNAAFPSIGAFVSLGVEDVKFGVGLELNGLPSISFGFYDYNDVNNRLNQVFSVYFTLGWHHYGFWGLDLDIGPTFAYSRNKKEELYGNTILHEGRSNAGILLAPSIRFSIPLDDVGSAGMVFESLDINIGYGFYFHGNDYSHGGLRFGISYSQ